jgi:hypothetical protein
MTTMTIGPSSARAGPTAQRQPNKLAERIMLLRAQMHRRSGST